MEQLICNDAFLEALFFVYCRQSMIQPCLIVCLHGSDKHMNSVCNYYPAANQYLHACFFQIYIVYNKRTGKPRGYAFIEYEHERDMHCEYQSRALSSNLMKSDPWSVTDHPFPLFYMDIFVMILGWQLSLTCREVQGSTLTFFKNGCQAGNQESACGCPNILAAILNHLFIIFWVIKMLYSSTST